MRFGSRVLASWVIPAATAGCGLGVVTEPPPRLPEQREPFLEDGPTAPPASGHGRVIIDADGETAKVSRVTEVQNHGGERRAKLDGTTSLAPPRSEELLCITPCAIDLRQGAHTFLFTSTEDPRRSSTTDVAVSSRTTVVRHAIGKEGHVTGGYVGGAMLLLLGGGITVMGGAITTMGAVGSPTVRDDGTTFDPQTLLIPGLAVLGIGLVTGTAGYLLMAGNRPVTQPGSTTYWTKAPPPPGGERSVTVLD